MGYILNTLSCLVYLLGLCLAKCEHSQLPNITCPSNITNAATCLGGPIIGRCNNGCAYPGRCTENLAQYPPYGSKDSAVCWQESDNSWNAQCTWDCVAVKLLNGTEIYPQGCSFAPPRRNSSIPPVTTSLWLPLPTPVQGSTNSSPTPASAPGVYHYLSSSNGVFPGLVGAVAAVVLVLQEALW
ncbi:hypothetical protein HD806DRAFT_153899 [Xylariaceae sp. AK1471]|nr:hypothetical protein HD806DRAFT_153899 [Xylariaceae sp. AK1471]